jgi:sugar lactone lactonase YvrE
MKRLGICILVSYLTLCSQVKGQNGAITTIAGNGTAGFSGDGGPATSAELYTPYSVAVDASGNLFIADSGNALIRKVSAGGIITTVAGTESQVFSGDGGPATSAALNGPRGVAVDAFGNIFIGDSGSSRVRKVSSSGIITTIAGNGTPGLSGDGGPAASASLSYPIGVAADTSGNLFIADNGNSRIRKVSSGGIIMTVAGSGQPGVYFDNAGFAGDGGPATAASVSMPYGVAVDTSGNLFIADTDNNRIRMVSANGVISTVAGSGAVIDVQNPENNSGELGLGGGDGGPATSATLDQPQGVAVDASGNIFIPGHR